MEKITRDNITRHLQEFQLKMIGKTIDDVKDDPEWFNNNTFTVEQLADFNVYALALIKKTFRMSTKKAKDTLGWFNLNYGLRVVPTAEEHKDIKSRIEFELKNKENMKKLISLVIGIILVITALALSSCHVVGEALHGGYGPVDMRCPNLNQNAYFYKKNTGKIYTFRNVMRTTKQK